MKKQRIVEILILIFVFLALLTGFLLFRHYKIEKPNTYNIVFEDIDSIVKGSPVRFMGINVGYVVKLRRKDKYIICKIRITKKGVKIPDSSRAKVAFNGLGGSKSIELLPPLTDDKNAKGIISSKSLRINDAASLVRDLRDVCIIINNFIQGIDTEVIMEDIRELTNPEIIDRVDEGIDKLSRGQTSSKKEVDKATERGGSVYEFIDWIQDFINKFHN